MASAPPSSLQQPRATNTLGWVSGALPLLLPALPVAKHCHQNTRSITCLRGIGLINLHGQWHFGDAALCLIASNCNRSQVHLMLYKSDAAQTKPSPGPQNAALLLWQSLSDGKSPLKTTAESAPRYQRFVPVATKCNKFLLQHLWVNLSVTLKVGAEMSRP